MDQTPSIGFATMKPDGTIVLRLRTSEDSGMIAEGFITYAPSDPQYAAVLKHLGGLKPGEEKSVPPWSD